jgi:hypothetical protein
MKTSWTILTLAGLLLSIAAFARPIHIPELPELQAEADLVAIIQPISTAKASDRLTSAGPKYGPRDPADYQGLNTQFKVLLVLKVSPGVAVPNGPITLLHFFFSAGPGEFNGGLFAYFNLPPTTLQTVASHRPGTKIAESPPTYLAFLKWHKDGRFRPVTGDYDSAPSFRILTTPYSAGWMYEADDILGLKSGTNQPVQRPGASRSAEDTNRTPAAAGSPR